MQQVKIQQKGGHVNVSLSELEIEAIVERKIDPFKKAVNPDSAPYLSVDHFMVSLGLLASMMTAILGYMWKKISTSSARLHERVDTTNKDVEDRENTLRGECTQKFDRLDDRVWNLAFHSNTNSKSEMVVLKPDEKQEKD